MSPDTEAAPDGGAEGGEPDTDPRGGGPETTEEPADNGDRIRGAPFVRLSGSVMSARLVPDEHPYLEGEVYLSTFPWAEGVNVALEAEREGVDLEAGFELSPDDAEHLGELLVEFAEKARAGEERRHP